MNNREYGLGLYEKALPVSLSWEEKLLACKEAGFDWLEISIDESPERTARLYWSKEQKEELLDAIRKTGVPIRTMCFSCLRKYSLGSLIPEKKDKVMDVVERAIDLAYDIGVRVVLMAAYDVHYEESTPETLKMMEINLRKAVDMAAKKGIILAFETMFDTELTDTIEKIMKYVKMIDSPYFKAFPDIGNLALCRIKYGWKDIHDDLYSGKGNIVAAHLKETIPGHDRMIPYGQGVTEYVESIRVLKELGVRMFTSESWLMKEDWLEDIKASSGFLREKLDDVFGSQAQIG